MSDRTTDHRLDHRTARSRPAEHRDSDRDGRARMRPTRPPLPRHPLTGSPGITVAVAAAVVALVVVALTPPVLQQLSRVVAEATLTALVLEGLAVVLLVRAFVRHRATDETTTGRVLGLEARAAAAEAHLREDEEKLHELRSTLVGVALASRLLDERGADLPESTRARLLRMQGAELARLERLLAPATRTPVRPVALATALEPVVEGARTVGIEIGWTPSPLRVMGRDDDVAEIVQVLLHNAARHAPGARVDIEATAGVNGVEVRVSDHGPGIDLALRPTIFRRGARADESPGSGLGLPIARRLAEGMGGTLRLDGARSDLRDQRQRGTTFVLTLPTAPASASAAMPRAAMRVGA